MYAVFTVRSGQIEAGATVQRFAFQSGGVAIAAILIGETGRGRSLGVLPVAGPAPEQPFKLMAAAVGETRSGKPRLIPAQAVTDQSAAVLVLPTPIGYRGGNNHTGDRTGTGEDGKALGFEPFPGRELARGRIAQGDAGGMGSGDQLVVLMPRGVVFRTSYSGRLYGGPAAHYYMFDGATVRAVTWDERELCDMDPLSV